MIEIYTDAKKKLLKRTKEVDLRCIERCEKGQDYTPVKSKYLFDKKRIVSAPMAQFGTAPA